MDQQQALSKVKKLLSLSESSNVNEAALAAAQAQRLMLKYEIEAAMLAEDEEEVDPLDNEVVEAQDLDDEKGNRKSWKLWLAQAITNVNQCMVYTSNCYVPGRYNTAKKLRIAGKPTQINKCKYLFQYLAGEIERLTQKEPKGLGRTWYNNFRIGAVDTIRQKLNETREEVKQEIIDESENKTTALVKVDKAIEKIKQREQETKEWEKAQGFVYGGRVSYRSHYSARQAGRDAAKSISINNASGALGAGQKRIVK